MTRSLLALVFALTTTLAGAQQQALALDELEKMALAAHPALAAGTAAVEAAARDAAQARAWINPVIAYVGDEISTGPVIRGGEQGVAIDQAIPLGGKLRLSREVLEAGVNEARARLERERLVVLTEVRTAYYEVLAAELRVDVRQRLAELAGEVRLVSSQLLNVGVADRPDTLMAEVELARAEVDLVEAQNALERAWTRLAVTVAQPGMPRREVAGSLDAPIPELPRDQTLGAALAASPELAERRAREERASREIAVARKVTFPDLRIAGGPRYNRERLEAGGKPVGLEWAVEAGVTVPLWNRNTNGIVAATARLAQARADRAALELALTRRFADLYDEFQTMRARAETYRAQVLPKAEEAHLLYLQRYQAMAASYPQVLTAQRLLFEANVQFLDALERARVAAVRMTNLTMGELSGGDTR
jgi:cobalt-zinc-cadmium efflux system outer membrane protein